MDFSSDPAEKVDKSHLPISFANESEHKNIRRATIQKYVTDDKENFKVPGSCADKNSDNVSLAKASSRHAQVGTTTLPAIIFGLG